MIFDIRSWCVIDLSVLNPITGNLHRGTSMGRRIKKSVYAYDPGKSPEWQLDKSILFVYDGWNVIEEITVEDGGVGGATQSSRYFVWGLDLSGSMQGAGGVGGLLAMVDPGEGKTYHYFYDANGNVGQMVDTADGSVAAHYEYAPFGKVIASHGDLKDENPFRFSTKYHDDETDLVYYGYRRYSPELGRWISRDPINELGSLTLRKVKRQNSSDLNLYTIISNDVINSVDLWGLCSSKCPDCKGGKWDVNTHGNISMVIGMGANRARITFTCLETRKKCTGVLDCSIFGPIVDIGVGWSFESDTLGGGSTISGYYCNSQIENYHTSSWVMVAGSLGTSGNNVNVAYGLSIGFAKQFCVAKLISCWE